ncbi:MAG: hypothetical protein OEZ43_00915 [Gammaproteobacteria bacterium]|nr:hypothetical protein [Gammaproteobacteria bacterium]
MGLYRRRRNTGKIVKQRFNGRTLIVHSGFPESWLKELLRQPGGGGYFRIDIRVQSDDRPSPVEKFVHDQLLPLELPLPFMAKIDYDNVYLRHLTRNDELVDPSEVGMIYTEIETRYHIRLSIEKAKTEAFPGMALDNNDIAIETVLA